MGHMLKGSTPEQETQSFKRGTKEEEEDAYLGTIYDALLLRGRCKV